MPRVYTYMWEMITSSCYHHSVNDIHGNVPDYSIISQQTVSAWPAIRTHVLEASGPGVITYSKLAIILLLQLVVSMALT